MKTSLKRISAVMIREFTSSAASPAAWIFLVIFLILSSFCTFMMSGVFSTGQADLGPFFDWMPWLFLLIVPALGMPLWADERRSGTLELTLSFPARLGELVFGKYLAGMLLLLTALLLTLSTPVTAWYLGEPDMGAVFCGYLGTLLIGSVFLSVACFCSALTKSQTASFLLSLLLCALLMFAGWPRLMETAVNYLPVWLVEGLGYCSILPHFQAFQRGILDSGEILYCVTTTFFFLYLAKASLAFAAAGAGNPFVPGTLKDPYAGQIFRTFSGGILTALFIFFCINVIASTFKFRLDLSSDRAYSLSPEAGFLAKKLDTPVNIRFYVTRSAVKMPAPFQKYAERVEWLLSDFAAASNGKITLTRLDPEPDSADEEAAVMEGVKPLPLNTGEKVFLGLSVSHADRCIPIPFLSPQQENMLEYEIVRALTNVIRPKRPTVGVISAFPVLGSNAPSEQLTKKDTSSSVKAPERAWYALSELSNDMELVSLPLDIAKIPEGIDSLLVIHPVGLSDRAAYAVDQYLMKGGRLALFLDPRSLYANLKSQKDFSFVEKGESSFEPLTSAWGLAYNKNLMVSDMNFAYRRTLPDRMTTNPLALNITPDGISRMSPVTASLSALSMYYTATLPLSNKVSTLKYEPLIHSTENSQIVSSMLDRPELAIRNFKASGERHVLAWRICGTFPSAFPEGAPDAVSTETLGTHRKNSEKNPVVFVFGDVDMLFNDVCIRVSQDAFGQITVLRQNDNLTLLQNVMEQLNGSDMLSSIRGRVPMSRPLTKINEIKAKAELSYKDRITQLERGLMEAQNRLRRIQNVIAASGGETRLTPEQERELREYTSISSEFKRELKNLRAKLRGDLDRLDNTVRLFNLVLVPLLVVIAGIAWSGIRLTKWRRRK